MRKVLHATLALVLVGGLAGQAGALTRPDVLVRARLYATVTWAINDTAKALYDSPTYRYRETGECNNHSPLVEWLLRPEQGGRFYDTYTGAPYAYGGRQTPEQATDWLSPGTNPVGLCKEQWVWRLNHARTPYCFAGASDCMMAAYATGWRDWKTASTQNLFDEAQSGADSYYLQLCTSACGGLGVDYEIPVYGDVLVKPGVHVEVWVSGGSTVPTGVIECTGDAEIERCVERTDTRTYEDFTGEGYWGVAVRALHDNPRTSFLSVSSPSAGILEWVTGWTSNTWGFAVTVSSDGQNWTKVGDYLPAEEPDSSEPKTWTWQGPLPASGLVRVVEIEAGSQRLQASPAIDIGRFTSK